jgi:glycosyltransferase involved in cell wall biosynthesis
MGRADVVHGTNFVLPPTRRAAGVLSVHDLSYLHHPELVSNASLAYRELVPRSIERADAVIAVSQAMATEITQAYPVDPAKIAVVPLGIDRRWFAATGRSLRPATVPDRYFLALGTLEPRKGLDVLLTAYRQLLDDESDPPALVLSGGVGWGPQIELAGIPPDKIILTGYVAQDIAVSLMRHAVALVFPSRYEGFGLPPLEALAAGTPVIASDLAVTREVLGRWARFVPPDDPGALADALTALLDQPPTEAELIGGRAHAAAFSWARCAQATVNVYRAAAAAR